MDRNYPKHPPTNLRPSDHPNHHYYSGKKTRDGYNFRGGVPIRFLLNGIKYFFYLRESNLALLKLMCHSTCFEQKKRRRAWTPGTFCDARDALQLLPLKGLPQNVQDQALSMKSQKKIVFYSKREKTNTKHEVLREN